MSVPLKEDEIHERDDNEKTYHISPASLDIDHEEWCHLVQTGI